MIRRFRSRRNVMLAGEGPLADACARMLEAGPDRVGRCDPSALDSVDLGRLDVLALAGVAKPAPLLSRLTPRLQGFALNRRLLRVLVIEDEPFGADTASAFEVAGLSAVMRLEFVSIPRRSARQLLARWPLHWGVDPLFDQFIHLVIVGKNAFADEVTVHALRIGAYSEELMRVSRLSDEPGQLKQRFDDAYPCAAQIAEIVYQSIARPNLADGPEVTGVVVCAESPQAGLEQAAMLRDHLSVEACCSPPIFIDVGDAQPSGHLAHWDGQLVPVSRYSLALEGVCSAEGDNDQMARVIHEHYRDTIAAQGRDPSAEPAGKPWEALAESYRDANRHQADHLWAKLTVADCVAVPEERVQSFAFAPLEVERLAVIEHARWAAERWLAGWSYAPVRDNRLKHHPQLRPYPELSEPMKDLDRFAVRLVPTLLARSGLGVLRVLLVGVSARQEVTGNRLQRLHREALARLTVRYPDRALIIATSLACATARDFLRTAVEEFDAGFFLLLEKPIADLLAASGSDERLETLKLVARAERRIQLGSEPAVDRWLATRAEILVELGFDPDVEEAGRDADRKCVRVDSEAGLAWNFEY